MILVDPSARPLIAHRGASADAPENTMEAFVLAAEQGCDAFELDVRLSADGVPVVLHDPTLDRTTDRSGEVRSLTREEIQAADAGAGHVKGDGTHPWRGRGVRVPALVELIRGFPDMPLLIEIKAPEAQHAVASLLVREGAVARAVVASFKARALSAFRRAPFLLGSSRRDILGMLARTRLGLGAPAHPCLCYAVPDFWKGRIEVPRSSFVAGAARRGKPVHVWTVDDPNRARVLWGRGVCGIITNRPGVMVARTKY